ncbi:hypothetical protein C8R47DRAFT_1217133 [Mycena vitilis]|nr:hypothetical protein C8R47DRAFT_1217133 [Mycena vitilis]
MSPLLSIIRDTTICQVSEELLQVEPDEIDKITTYCQKALDCVDGEVDKASTKCVSSPTTVYEMLLAGHDRNEPRAGVKKILTQKAIQIGGRVPNVWGSKDDAIKIFLSLRCNFVLGSLCQQLVPLLAKALSLPNLLRQAQQTGLIDFTRNPQPILRAQTSEENWDAMVWEPRTVMRAYKLSLQHAIEEDKEAEDEKRADLIRTDILINYGWHSSRRPLRRVISPICWTPSLRKTFPIIRAKLQCGTSRVFKAANNLGATRFNQIEASVTCPFPSVLALRVRPAVRKLSRLNWQADGNMQQRIRFKQAYQFPTATGEDERWGLPCLCDTITIVPFITFCPAPHVSSNRCRLDLENHDRKPPPLFNPRILPGTTGSRFTDFHPGPKGTEEILRGEKPPPERETVPSSADMMRKLGHTVRKALILQWQLEIFARTMTMSKPTTVNETTVSLCFEAVITRACRHDDMVAVKEVIEWVMNVKIDEVAIYNLHNADVDFAGYLDCPIPISSPNLVWTRAM